MPSLWFCVPVHGRLELTAICLRQLRRTCDALNEEGVHASAVIVASKQDLRALPDLGFGSVERDNKYLGRKFNDGIMLATDPRYNGKPADYVVPCGSDDWVDHRLFLDLPAQDTIIGFQRMSFVREDGQAMISASLDYRGGSGIRIIPRALVEPLTYRPADEDRRRACDTSILSNLTMFHEGRLKVEHRYLHDRQIVDWKTRDTQINSFQVVSDQWRDEETVDPFTELAGLYPAEALEEMRSYYVRQRNICSRCQKWPAVAAGCNTWDGPVCDGCSRLPALVSA